MLNFCNGLRIRLEIWNHLFVPLCHLQMIKHTLIMLQLARHWTGKLSNSWCVVDGDFKVTNVGDS